MTTIAADVLAGLMCSDSKWSDDNTVGIARKVWRVQRALIGAAGELDEMSRWLALYRAAGKLRGASLSVLRLSTGGLDCWTHIDGWVPILDKQFAIGTGGAAARGAMAAGAACPAAVRIACHIDASTRGPVRSYKLRAAT